MRQVSIVGWIIHAAAICTLISRGVFACHMFDSRPLSLNGRSMQRGSLWQQPRRQSGRQSGRGKGAVLFVLTDSLPLVDARMLGLLNAWMFHSLNAKMLKFWASLNVWVLDWVSLIESMNFCNLVWLNDLNGCMIVWLHVCVIASLHCWSISWLNHWMIECSTAWFVFLLPTWWDDLFQDHMVLRFHVYTIVWWHGCMTAWLNLRRMNKLMNDWAGEWKDRLNEWMNEWMIEWTNEWSKDWMSGVKQDDIVWDTV